MKAKEYLEKNYGQGHLQSVMQLDDILSIFALMDEFAEYKVKNCNAPAVSKCVEPVGEGTVCCETCKYYPPIGLNKEPCNDCIEYDEWQQTVC